MKTPEVRRDGTSLFVGVSGVFYRAVPAESCGEAPAGSFAAGRYSRPGQRTLYMSVSVEGVVAAMRAHPPPEGRRRRLCPLQAEARGIFDFRDDAACAQAGIRREDALGDWQALIRNGREPLS